MTKKELLAAIADLGDDDLIMIAVDGGEYWGDYLDTPTVTIMDQTKVEIMYSFGHQGGTTTKFPEGVKVAVLSDA